MDRWNPSGWFTMELLLWSCSRGEKRIIETWAPYANMMFRTSWAYQTGGFTEQCRERQPSSNRVNHGISCIHEPRLTG